MDAVSVRFYMDEHIPRPITSGLRARGIDVLTTQEDRRDGTPDPLLLDRSGELGRVLLTQDEDFLAEAHRRQAQNIPFFGIIYIHQLRTSIGRCIDDLELIAKATSLEDYTNRVEFLPL